MHIKPAFIDEDGDDIDEAETGITYSDEDQIDNDETDGTVEVMENTETNDDTNLYVPFDKEDDDQIFDTVYRTIIT